MNKTETPQHKWRRNNPEKWAAIVLRYKTSGKYELSQKRYYAKNRERIKQRNNKNHRLRRLNHPEAVRLRDRTYAKTLTGRWNSYRRSASCTGREFSLTKEEFREFWQKPCIYCGSEIMTIGLDRVDNTQGYLLENVVPCCGVCNLMKKNMTAKMFLNHLRRIVAWQDIPATQTPKNEV